MTSVFRIIYTQEVVGSEDNALLETSPQIFFQISRAAVTTGWFLRHFGSRRNGDFAVLVAIGLHARRLIGDDLELLIRLGLASTEDAGRLYARITDSGLADILGRAHRESLRSATDRLAGAGLLRILELPPGFRDSRGQYAGDRAYVLLASQVISQANDVDRARLPGTVRISRARLPGTVKGSQAPDRARLPGTKLIPTAYTLANASGAQSAPASLLPSSSPSAPEAERRASQLTLGLSGNGSGDNLAQATAEGVSEVSQPPELVDRLNTALEEKSTAQAFLALLEAIEQAGGLTAASFRTARLGMATTHARRRRVLEDLRRMQARTDLKPHMRKSNVVAILTQNIGATIGLGLGPDGQVRMVPGKADFGAIGGLADEYGVEIVWMTACDIAGAAIKGDPLDYLRAALRRKRERGGNGQQAGESIPAAEAFERIDYSRFET